MFVQLTKDFLGRRAGERIDVSPADAQSLIGAGSAPAIADDPISTAVTRALDGALGRLTENLDGAINQALKSGDGESDGQTDEHPTDGEPCKFEQAAD